jgi:Rrf2 family protein
MRISAKGRYALAAIIHMAQGYSKGECITIISISEKLGISKIYLEQVFSLLKRGEIVNSVKGAQGGYMLARMPREISVYEVLLAVESSMFEGTEPTVGQKAPQIDNAMRLLVFQPLDEAVKNSLMSTTLDDLVHEVDKQNAEHGLMYFI